MAFLIILGLAVTLQPGTLSAFTYAFAFFQLPYGLIAVSITTASLPELAEAATDGRVGDFRRRFTEGTSLLLAFMVPSAVGVVLLARPLVQLVLQRGSFSAADTTLTAEMLQGFAVGLPAFAVYLFVVRAFYARRDTRTPFWLNLTQNVLNVAIMFPLTAALDAAGLALAYSLSYWVIVVVALLALHRAVRRDGGDEPGALLGRVGLTALARSVAVAAVVAVALVATFELLRPASDDRALLEVVVGLAVGLASFAGATFLLRPSGFEPAVDRLRRGWRSRGRSMSN